MITSLVGIILGVFIIITKNPVISVLFLIGLFFTISLYLMILGLYFIGLSYLLVYIGAISILFLFILMLINVRVSELVTEGKNSIPLAVIAILSFNLTINSIIPYSFNIFDALSSYLVNIYKLTSFNLSLQGKGNSLDHKGDLHELAIRQLANKDVASVAGKSWDASLIEVNHMTSVGNILYTNVFMLLIITSLVLLLAMVGSIIITVKRKTN